MLIVLFAIIAFVVAADQITKAVIFGHDMAVINGFVRFASTENTGVAWGLLNGVKGSTIILSVFTAVVIAAMIFLMIKYRKVIPWLVGVPFAAVVGGAVGNLIDRVFLGYVRAFIATEFIDFPVFTVADCFVTCGGIFLVIALFFTKPGKAFMNAVFPEKK